MGVYLIVLILGLNDQAIKAWFSEQRNETSKSLDLPDSHVVLHTNLCVLTRQVISVKYWILLSSYNFYSMLNTRSTNWVYFYKKFMQEAVFYVKISFIMTCFKFWKHLNQSLLQDWIKLCIQPFPLLKLDNWPSPRSNKTNYFRHPEVILKSSGSHSEVIFKSAWRSEPEIRRMRALEHFVLNGQTDRQTEWHLERLLEPKM